MAFTYVTITHTFETAADVSAAGEIDFTPIEPMHNDITVVQKPITATLSGAGGLSQLLAANTDPDTRPTGTTYRVVERITGQPELTYFVQVPHDQGSVLDLRDLAGWQGGTGGGGAVSTINGEAPDGSGDVTISAADVGAQLADGDLTGLAALGDGVPVRASGTWGLASGTRDGTRFLRDDGTWQTATGGAAYTDEQVRDVIAAALVEGPNVTITPNDGADTITISAAASGSAGIPASTVNAKGDLIAGTADDTVGVRSVGTNGQSLLADSAQSTGLAWGAPVPADSSVTNVKVAAGAAISADKLADGTSLKVMTAAERTKLAGLATIATSGSASDLGAGTVATARLGSGTADATTFLRGDNTWAPAGGSAITANTQTGSSYTLVLADAGKVVERNNAAANTTTVPPNSSVAFPVGTIIEVAQLGAGQTTIVAGAGVTLRTPATLALRTRYSTVALRKRATDEWVVSGDTA